MINFFTKLIVKRFKNILKRLFYEKNTYSCIIFIKKSYFSLNSKFFHSKIKIWQKKTR